MSAKKDPEEKYVKSTISFEPEMWDTLNQYCRDNERTLSWVVRKALESWLNAHKDDRVD